ncbi:PAS domain-containing protein [Rhizobium beringeri]
MDSESPQPLTARFPVGGGEIGRLIQTRDWSKTPLGPLDLWPQSLKTATNMLLLSPVPIVLLWGQDGVMIYNDAYSVFAGSRHPDLLGSKVREGWSEIADFNDNVMKVGLSGKTLAYENQELTLLRHGSPAPAWMNLDYSPVLDESGKPAGVIAIVVETTKASLPSVGCARAKRGSGRSRPRQPISSTVCAPTGRRCSNSTVVTFSQTRPIQLSRGRRPICFPRTFPRSRR